MEKSFIASTPSEIKKLLPKGEVMDNLKGKNKVAPLKATSFRIPEPMEAITTISSFPQLQESSYLEKRNPNEEEDFYALREKFSDLVGDSLGTNKITSFILGEAFAKKVRYGVTYSPSIENIINYVSELIMTEPFEESP